MSRLVAFFFSSMQGFFAVHHSAGATKMTAGSDFVGMTLRDLLENLNTHCDLSAAICGIFEECGERMTFQPFRLRDVGHIFGALLSAFFLELILISDPVEINAPYCKKRPVGCFCATLSQAAAERFFGKLLMHRLIALGGAVHAGDFAGNISRILREKEVTGSGCKNTFGEEQLSVDLVAEKRLRDWAKGCQAVKAVSSEEATDLVEVNSGGSVIICWDPLDGSSVVDCNWSVASIFGIWQTGRNGVAWKGAETLISCTGRQQVASVLVIYGPRTTALLSISGRTFDFQLKSWGGPPVVVRGPCNIKKEGAKIFSPANLRAAQDLPAYDKLLHQWMKKRYTLRYTGGLGPDVYQLFVKGHGVFCNPASEVAPAKLRLAYEVAPIAFLVEAAGGLSSDGKGSALDLALKTMDHRTAFCCGSEEEVRQVEAELKCSMERKN